MIKYYLPFIIIMLSHISPIYSSPSTSSLLDACEKDRQQLNDQSKISKKQGSLVAPACMILWEKARVFFEFESQVRDLAWVVYPTSRNIKLHQTLAALQNHRAYTPSKNCHRAPYIVTGSYSNEGNTALYLGKAEQLRAASMIKAEPCGWVNIDDVITRVQPIKTNYATFKKAHLVFKLDDPVKEIERYLNFYTQPHKNAIKGKPVPLQALFYIYKERYVQGQLWYYVITDSYLAERRYSKAHKGWLPADRLASVSGGALYPSEINARQKIAIYRNERAAKNKISKEILVHHINIHKPRPISLDVYHLLLQNTSPFCPQCNMVAFLSTHYKASKIQLSTDFITTDTIENMLKRDLSPYGPFLLLGHISLPSNFNQAILFSRGELSEYIGAISDVVNQGDRISILKAMKLTCQNLRAENLTGSSCNLMRDAIVDVDAYELLKRSPEDILKSLRDPRFYDTIQKKAVKSLRKLDVLIGQKESFFPIGLIDYIWLRQDEML